MWMINQCSIAVKQTQKLPYSEHNTLPLLHFYSIRKILKSLNPSTTSSTSTVFISKTDCSTLKNLPKAASSVKPLIFQVVFNYTIFHFSQEYRNINHTPSKIRSTRYLHLNNIGKPTWTAKIGTFSSSRSHNKQRRSSILPL